MRRSIPLPEDAKIEDVKATFKDGVLEVSVALPTRAETKPRNVDIQETTATTKAAA